MSNTALLIVILVVVALALLYITTPPDGYCADKNIQDHFDLDEYHTAKANMFMALYLLYARPSSPVLSSVKSELADRLHSIKEGYLIRHPNSKVPAMVGALVKEALYQAQQGWVIVLPPAALKELGESLARDQNVPADVVSKYVDQIGETADYISQVSNHLFRREYNQANRLWVSKVEGRYFLKEN